MFLILQMYDSDKDRWEDVSSIETPYTGISCCSIEIYSNGYQGDPDTEVKLHDATPTAVPRKHRHSDRDTSGGALAKIPPSESFKKKQGNRTHTCQI